MSIMEDRLQRNIGGGVRGTGIGGDMQPTMPGLEGRISSYISQDAPSLTDIGQPQGLEGAGSNALGANLIGAGIETGATIVGGIMGAREAGREREKEYRQGLDDLFEKRRRQEEQQRVALEEERRSSMMNRLGYEIAIFEREMEEKMQKVQRVVSNADRLRGAMQQTRQMRDSTRALGSGGQ